MSDEQAPPPPAALAFAAVVRRRRISLAWLIPLITLLAGGWLAWDTLSTRGPLIQISLNAAEGLVAGQSHVQDRGLDIGLVE